MAGFSTDTPLATIGIGLSGAVFYYGFTTDGLYVVELEILDQCGRHSDSHGVYHYHE